MKILVSGLINTETNVAVSDFPIPYTPIEYAFNKVSTNISGVAYNVISALHTLGDDVLPISIIGKDIQGAMILQTLTDLSVSTSLVKRDMDSTCTSVVLFDSDGKRKIYCDLKDIQDRIYPYDTVEDEIKECDGLVICNINFNDELIKKAKTLGKPILTDVHVLRDIHDSYNARFLQNADVVFLSDEGLPCEPEEFLLQIYNEYHNKAIVLGQGSKGALLFDGKNECFSFVPSVSTRKVVNTCGAGDSLFSCFTHFYIKAC